MRSSAARKITFAILLAAAILPATFLSPFIRNADATDVTGNITSNTTWTLANSPYNMTGHVTVTNNATLTIDAGVVVRSNGNYFLTVNAGSTIDVNGSSGSMVTFQHNTATSADSWEGLRIYGTATVDYANFYHTDVGIRSIGGTVTVNDSLFETNRVGIAGWGQSTLTTARNTFNKQTYFPISINPDNISISLGSGADVDILGTSTNVNGYNGIGLGYSENSSNDCPSNTCTLAQYDFAGINSGNAPYVMLNDFFVGGSDDTLVVDAGVIIKNSSSSYEFIIQNGASIDVNGSSGNEVVFTSIHDDTPGGDTNNNGSATTPSAGNWSRMELKSGTNAIDYAQFLYANTAIYEYNSGTSLTVNDSLFESNAVGIDLADKAVLTTNRNTFQKQTIMPVSVNPDSTVTFGSGANIDILGTGTDVNFFDGIGLTYNDNNTTDCDTNVCTIPQRNFAGINGGNAPYYIRSDYFFQGADDTFVINAGVILKFSSSSTEFYTQNGATLDVNGSSGNEVIFTSYRDDTYGGDNNNDGSASSPSEGDWHYFDLTGGANTVDYAKFYYADTALYARNDSTTLTVNDSLFENNNVGIDIAERATLTTNRNTFNSQSYFPVNINLDSFVTFGSGGNIDIVGTGADVNGYNAIGLRYNDNGVNNCSSNTCTIPQRNFAGINSGNTPYYIRDSMWFQGSDDTLVVNAGVVIKFSGGGTVIFIQNGAHIDLNGTNGNEVIFTSYRDDTYGGDMNNDGSATSPSVGNWDRFQIEGGTNTIDYTKVFYGNTGFYVYNTGTTMTVSDSLFGSNNVALDITERATLTTYRNTFNSNLRYPVSINPDAFATFGSGADADALGTGGNVNGYNAIGLRYNDSNTTNCTSNLCTLAQRTFAGISNIPYVLLDDYWFQGSDDTLQINAGVIIKIFGSDREIYFTNGAILDINGTSGNKVVITSARDDTIGGDTNNDGSSSTPSPGNWNRFQFEAGTITIDYAEFYYGSAALYALNSGTSLTINDTLFDNNNIGFEADSYAAVTTNRNNFTNQVYTPIVLNPDVGTVTLGTGANVDSVGTGADSNGYDAIGIGYVDSNTGSCPSSICLLPQRSFADINGGNVPYLLYGDYTVSGSGNTLRFDAGVVMKIRGSSTNLAVTSGALVDINGSSGNWVYITSAYDDSIVGDTNNDGTATSPYPGSWDDLSLASNAVHTIDFLDVRYAAQCTIVSYSSTTINDSNYSYCEIAILSNSSSSPTLARLNIEHSNTYGMRNDVSNTINAETLWWGDSAGPIDTDAGGACGTNAGGANSDTVRDTASYPIDYCPYSTTKFNANTPPVAASTSVNSGATDITLTENTTTVVTCTSTVTDADGFTDILSVEAKFFRTGVGESASDDDNNHYTVSGDSNCVPSNGSGTTEDYTCTIPVWFHADPTDTGTYSTDDWTCQITPSDGQGAGTADTDTIEMDTLRALNVTASIDYGSLDPGSDSESTNQQTTVTNTGNSAIDIELSGAAMCTDFPTCSAYVLGVANQEYSLTTFTYGGGTDLSITPTAVNISISKPTDNPSNQTSFVYWGIGIPLATYVGLYTGQNVFTAISDT